MNSELANMVVAACMWGGKTGSLVYLDCGFACHPVNGNIHEQVFYQT